MTVVILDDEPLMLRMMEKVVKTVLPDADLHTFSDSAALLGFAKEQTIAIAFLDIQMRGITGTEVSWLLQSMQPRLNVIFCTAYDDYKGKAMDLHASGYLMKPVSADDIRRELTMLRFPIGFEREEAPSPERLQVTCFGDFRAVFHNAPLPFRYSKTLELLAFLIDRKGAVCPNTLIAEMLWNSTGMHTEYLKKLRRDLQDTLASLGLGDILCVQKGQISIVPERIQCDYYEFLAGKQTALQQYRGIYMGQYTWAEETNALLYWKKEEQV